MNKFFKSDFDYLVSPAPILCSVSSVLAIMVGLLIKPNRCRLSCGNTRVDIKLYYSILFAVTLHKKTLD